MFRPNFVRSIFRAILAAAFAIAAVFPGSAAQTQKSNSSQDDKFDVRSSVGDLHVGKDADARKAGLPLYPGARPKQEKDNDPLNFGILTEAFGWLSGLVRTVRKNSAPSY